MVTTLWLLIKIHDSECEQDFHSVNLTVEPYNYPTGMRGVLILSSNSPPEMKHISQNVKLFLFPSSTSTQLWVIVLYLCLEV
ncbi:hypothetical protein T06_1912 [Trichinella sp. T6]|nr:hypothetical protein T06_1912 [Trichinella sp. T6]